MARLPTQFMQSSTSKHAFELINVVKLRGAARTSKRITLTSSPCAFPAFADQLQLEITLWFTYGTREKWNARTSRREISIEIIWPIETSRNRSRSAYSICAFKMFVSSHATNLKKVFSTTKVSWISIAELIRRKIQLVKTINCLR